MPIALWSKMCYHIITESEKKPQQKASQRLQREPTNNGSVSQKGDKNSITENGLTTQNPPGQCSP